jgi:hypothetical protein
MRKKLIAQIAAAERFVIWNDTRMRDCVGLGSAGTNHKTQRKLAWLGVGGAGL